MLKVKMGLVVVPLIGMALAPALTVPAGASPAAARIQVRAVHLAPAGVPNSDITGKGVNSLFSPSKLTIPLTATCTVATFTVTNTEKVSQVVTFGGTPEATVAAHETHDFCAFGGTFGEQLTLGLERANGAPENGTLTVKLGNPVGSPTFKKVTFSGSAAAPKVTVTGNGFGTVPTGTSDNATSCGNYTSNGDDYGATALWFNDTGNFNAGQGTPPSGACIGIIVSKWSNTKVVFEFGNAYDTFGPWVLTNGDSYTLSVNGGEKAGTVKLP